MVTCCGLFYCREQGAPQEEWLGADEEVIKQLSDRDCVLLLGSTLLTLIISIFQHH